MPKVASPDYRTHARIFTGVVAVILVILAARLLDLQVIDFGRYAQEARDTGIRARAIPPERGAMYDRHGQLLVGNTPTYSILVTPVHFDTSTTATLAGLLNEPDSLLQAEIRAAGQWNPFRASPVAHGISFDELGRLEEDLYALPGVDVTEESTRSYPLVHASHLFGYVSEISGDELDRRREDGYRMGDEIGQTGLESSFEPYLRGVPGVRYEMVGIHGQELEAYRDGADDVSPRSGYDLHLTLDAGLQALAESLFVHKRGAAVALDPSDGEVLAFLSAPDYDPALLAGTIKPDVWKALNDAPYHPLFDRALLSGEPTGSTIKPFMGLVGLQEGTISPETAVHCHGAYYYGGHRFGDDATHGTVAVQDAIRVSCDVFFYTLMMRLNFAHWSHWGHIFGFGQDVPIELPRQNMGIWPDSAYFDRTYGDNGWTRGYLVSLGIGQGNISVTPMQLAQYAMVLANGGTRYAPHAVQYMENPDTGERLMVDRPAPVKIPIEAHYFALVRQAMRMVVQSGTGRIAQIPGIEVAGKTGTAQNPHGKDHSLFIAFAPFDHPRIAVAVFVENAGFGASVAAPIASLMIEQYLTGGISPERRSLLQYVLHNVRSEGM